MKKFVSLSLSLFSALWINAQEVSITPKSWTADNGNGTYTNPLLYDEFYDPDIIRVGDDYYLAITRTVISSW